MNEQKLRGLIEDVRAGRRTRREFINQMIALGLTAPLASAMLLQSGVAMAATPFQYKPTKRGGGGTVKVLWWEAPTLLNPHFAVGTKDQDASRIFYEPLANWDAEGNLVPVLATEIPTIKNGGLSEDGKSVVWKLKKGASWHDGKPFNADDCVFTWEYVRDPATTTYDIATYQAVNVTKLDDYTIKLAFQKPTPYWADAFVGVRGMILPKHVFEPYQGAKSRQAPANLAPVGTGPYEFVEFRPGDLVRGKIYMNYHEANHPYFDAIEMKGGGDAVSAARAVMQTGEFDYAWDLQVEERIIKQLEKAGKGRLVLNDGGD
ncbi:MAG: ABC transporter substrate-binding protein, partial [Acetobacteraceae bacterium]